MQIEFWVEVYFETRRFRPLSSSPHFSTPASRVRPKIE